jgi:hypothetical protein
MAGHEWRVRNWRCESGVEAGDVFAVAVTDQNFTAEMPASGRSMTSELSGAFQVMIAPAAP